jgi:hypothetical protein
MIMKASISPAIKGAIPDKKENGKELSAKEFLAYVEENFKSSSKTYASTLIMKMCTSCYDGQGGIREQIMSMCDLAAKLKALDMSISEGFLVHFIMTSLPAHYSPFKIRYNTQKGKWSISELISYCVEEEERQKSEKKDMANLVAFGKGKHQADASSSKQPKKSSSQIRITTIITIIIILRILARTILRIMLKMMTLMFVASVARLSTSRRIALASRSGLRRRVMILSLF